MGNIFKRRRNRDQDERSAALSRSISLVVNRHVNTRFIVPSAVGTLYYGTYIKQFKNNIPTFTKICIPRKKVEVEKIVQ